MGGRAPLRDVPEEMNEQTSCVRTTSYELRVTLNKTKVTEVEKVHFTTCGEEMFIYNK